MAKNRLLIFILLLFLLHGSFFLFAVKSGHIYLANDSYEYLNQSKNLQEHGSWYAGEWSENKDGFLTTRRPPLYGLFLMCLKLVSVNDYFILFVQCLLGVFNFLFLIKTLKLFYPSLKKINWILFFLVLFPTQLIYANMIMPDVLFQTMCIALFYYFVLFIQKNQISDFILYNAFISLALLIKPLMIFFWIPSLIFSIYIFYRFNLPKIKSLLALIPALIIFLVSWYNYNQNGYFQYSNVMKSHLVDYFAYNTMREVKSAEETEIYFNAILKEASTKRSNKEYSEFVESESWKVVKEYPLAFLKVNLHGVYLFFFDHSRWDLYSFFVQPNYKQEVGMAIYFEKSGLKGVMTYLAQFNIFLLIYLLLIYLTNILLFISLLFFLLNKNVNGFIRFAVLMFVVYHAAVTGLIGCSRYRMAVYPMLLMTIPFFIDQMKLRFPVFKKLSLSE